MKKTSKTGIFLTLAKRFCKTFKTYFDEKFRGFSIISILDITILSQTSKTSTFVYRSLSYKIVGSIYQEPSCPPPHAKLFGTLLWSHFRIWYSVEEIKSQLNKRPTMERSYNGLIRVLAKYKTATPKYSQ